jgi:hypothetical protein
MRARLMRARLRALLTGIVDYAAFSARPVAAGPGQRRHRMKIRCGGQEPKDFPSGKQLAGIIHICRERGIQLKATA